MKDTDTQDLLFQIKLLGEGLFAQAKLNDIIEKRLQIFEERIKRLEREVSCE